MLDRKVTTTCVGSIQGELPNNFSRDSANARADRPGPKERKKRKMRKRKRKRENANFATFFSQTPRKFYELEVLKPYKWYWRLEPDVEYTCAITYDPFVQMAKSKKVYGYTIALWEVGKSCPALFRATTEWKAWNGLRSGELWKAMVEASWLPFPFRRLLSWMAHRDAAGDAWSLCHFWSNFEIADMDFFRSRVYQDYFAALDKAGGFYHERVSSYYYFDMNSSLHPTIPLLLPSPLS